DARLADEMPAEEADWLRQRAPGWTVGGLIGLITELSNALARTKDAQQFQIQTELALLAACETAAERHEDALEQEGPGGAKAPREAPRTDAAAERSSEAGLREARPSAPSIEAPPEQAPVPSTLAVASAPAETPDLGTIQARWPDVVDYVTQRKRMLGVMMSSTQPLGLEEGGQRLVVGFGTDFNLKRAEQFGNRQAIEEGVRHVYGRSYRLRCTLGASGEGTALLDDPVISYAVRTFGGEPRRVES
ncbi:MAG TPA: hypothetical protein VFA49_05950, partial [Chloroflexota bacterium]|nr:hypothetical protein [Chloroflexota bacterium]